ncbi:MAG: hypothetical protein ACK595_00910 [Planctomycetota bacterium]|jgi:hypothetical protein
MDVRIMWGQISGKGAEQLGSVAGGGGCRARSCDAPAGEPQADRSPGSSRTAGVHGLPVDEIPGAGTIGADLPA